MADDEPQEQAFVLQQIVKHLENDRVPDAVGIVDSARLRSSW